MKNIPARTPAFSRNQNLESLLDILGNILEKAEADATRNFFEPRFPVVLVHGCARSGTTLMMQLLASTGIFAYPTNLISRFYRAPYIGALIQLMLTDPEYNFRNEFSELRNIRIDYSSSLGKTAGILSPNEFYYFWRRFFQFDDIQYLDKEQLRKIDSSLLLAELAAFENTFSKPVLMKGMLMNWNIDFLNDVLPHPVFVHVTRDTLFNAQSLLEARESFYADVNQWYSFKPPEYTALKNEDPMTQVVGQVICTNRAISASLNNVNDDRKMTIDYETLCKAPHDVIIALLELIEKQGYPRPEYDRSCMPSQFSNRDIIRIGEAEWRLLEQARDTVDKKLGMRNGN